MTLPPSPTPGLDPDDRRKHLEFVQGVITRLSNSSATAKGWSLTVAGAAFGFSTLNERWYLSLLGLCVVGIFSIVDMHYLFEERLFRRLYNGVRQGTVDNFSMDKNIYRSSESKLKTYFSWSVVGFYLALALAGIAVVIFALTLQGPKTSETPKEKHSTSTPCGHHAPTTE